LSICYILQRRKNVHLPGSRRNQAPHFLQDVHGSKNGQEKYSNASSNTKVEMQDASTMCTEADLENEKSEIDVDEYVLSKSRDEQTSTFETSDSLSNPKSWKTQTSEPQSERSSEKTSSQLNSTTTSGNESRRKSIDLKSYHHGVSSKQGSITTSAFASMSFVASEVASQTEARGYSTPTYLKGYTVANKSLKRPAVGCLGYMTRGFKFSYFQYYSN